MSCSSLPFSFSCVVVSYHITSTHARARTHAHARTRTQHHVRTYAHTCTHARSAHVRACLFSSCSSSLLYIFVVHSDAETNEKNEFVRVYVKRKALKAKCKKPKRLAVCAGRACARAHVRVEERAQLGARCTWQCVQAQEKSKLKYIIRIFLRVSHKFEPTKKMDQLGLGIMSYTIIQQLGILVYCQIWIQP